MRAGLYSVRSLDLERSEVVVLDDAEFRLKLRLARIALEEIARLTTDGWSQRVARAALRSIDEEG